MSHNQTVSVLHQICLSICRKKENVSIKLCHKTLCVSAFVLSPVDKGGRGGGVGVA